MECILANDRRLRHAGRTPPPSSLQSRNVSFSTPVTKGTLELPRKPRAVHAHPAGAASRSRRAALCKRLRADAHARLDPSPPQHQVVSNCHGVGCAAAALARPRPSQHSSGSVLATLPLPSARTTCAGTATPIMPRPMPPREGTKSRAESNGDPIDGDPESGAGYPVQSRWGAAPRLGHATQSLRRVPRLPRAQTWCGGPMMPHGNILISRAANPNEIRQSSVEKPPDPRIDRLTGRVDYTSLHKREPNAARDPHSNVRRLTSRRTPRARSGCRDTGCRRAATRPATPPDMPAGTAGPSVRPGARGRAREGA